MTYVRIAAYLACIAMAATLREPWMIAMQAGIGGLALGAHIERMASMAMRRASAG